MTQKQPISDARLAANRANSQLSTGPKTEEGKAASSRNNFRHGFTGAFTVLIAEDKEAFEKLVQDLLDEHQPGTTTENMLVNDMARHWWLTQRALRLQEHSMIFDRPGDHDLNLYIRYQTSNQRAFHKALETLLKLKKQRAAEQRGFESKKRSEVETKPAPRSEKIAPKESVPCPEPARSDSPAENSPESIPGAGGSRPKL